MLQRGAKQEKYLVNAENWGLHPVKAGATVSQTNEWESEQERNGREAQGVTTEWHFSAGMFNQAARPHPYNEF